MNGYVTAGWLITFGSLGLYAAWLRARSSRLRRTVSLPTSND